MPRSIGGTDVPVDPIADRSTTSKRSGITPGVVDAAMSSMATFAAALIAARVLTDVELGVYAVFYTSFNFGQVIANNLVFVPAEVAVIAWPVRTRLRVFSQSFRMGLMPSLAGALAVGIATIITFQVAEASLVLPLTITTGITTFLWPNQDHLRRTLHIADLSWAAATVSVVQFVTVAASITTLLIIGTPDAWIPYGSLAIGNAVSLVVGLAIARRSLTIEKAPDKLHRRSLTKSGGWLLAGVGAPTLAAMGAATIITLVAGPKVLGYAEAARIAAQPVLVLGTGVGFVLGPKVMRGAIARDKEVSKTTHLRFNALVLGAALAYTLIAGWNWPGNPMAALLPNAFQVAWLVPVTILAHVTMASMVLVQQELMALRQARFIGIVGLLSAPLQLAAAATAGFTGAFARPLSVVAGTGTRLFANANAIIKSYGPDE